MKKSYLGNICAFTDGVHLTRNKSKAVVRKSLVIIICSITLNAPMVFSR